MMDDTDRLNLDPPLVRAPEFAAGDWLNGPPLSREQLRGRIILVDFWDYTCLNCIRTLPYLAAWHQRYAPLGLTIIGVHAPEFKFAHDRNQIEAAIDEFGLPYPVLLDNRYETWSRFANRAWPTKHLIDNRGYIRYRQQGEGRYRETEQAIQALVRQRSPDAPLPDLMPLLREEDAPGAVCYRPTPELHTGFERGALGNRQGYAPDNPVVYEMPLERFEPSFYADGIFRAGREHFAFAGQNGGRVALPYSAVEVNAVLSPSSDPVEIMLDLMPDHILPIVEIRQDGRPLTPINAGEDIEYDDGGISIVTVNRPRMYNLVKNPDFESHELELIFRANGIALYAFTFASCVARGADPDDPDTLMMR